MWTNTPFSSTSSATDGNRNFRPQSTPGIDVFRVTELEMMGENNLDASETTKDRIILELKARLFSMEDFILTRFKTAGEFEDAYPMQMECSELERNTPSQLMMTELKNLKAERTDLKTELEQLKINLRGAGVKINELRTQLEASQAEKEQLLAKMIKPNTPSPLMKTELEQLKVNLHAAQVEIKKLRTQLEAAQVEKEQLNVCLHEATYSQQRNTPSPSSLMKTELEHLKAERTDLKTELEQLKVNLHAAQVEINKLRTQLEAAQMEKEQLNVCLHEAMYSQQDEARQRKKDKVPENTVKIIKELVARIKADEEKLKLFEGQLNTNNQPQVQNEISSTNEGNSEKVKLEDEKELLKKQLIEKDEMIEQLNEELKKRTYNLQELVNKELWDKNREIEKLNKVCERRKREIASLQSRDKRNGIYFREIQPSDEEECKENVPTENADLKQQFESCLQEKECLVRKITELEERTRTESECSLIQNLRLECSKRKRDLELVEKSRQEAYNACSLLTTRLEELTDFLEMLLSNDFSSINTKKREILRQAIERSREISKSFSITFPTDANVKIENIDLSVPILPDCSEINLSFSGGDNDDDATTTSKRSESEDSRSIFHKIRKGNYSPSSSEFLDRINKLSGTMPDIVQGRLQNPVSFVKYLGTTNELVFTSGKCSDSQAECESIPEIQFDRITVDSFPVTIDSMYADKGTIDSIPDDRVNDFTDMSNSYYKSQTVTASSALVSIEDVRNTGYDSESEPWSEPDRNVSAARIGIQDSAHKNHRRSRQVARIDSDSDVCNVKNNRYGKRHTEESSECTTKNSNQREIGRSSPHSHQCGRTENVALSSYRYMTDLDSYRTSMKMIKQLLEQILRNMQKPNKGSSEKVVSTLKNILEEFKSLEHFCSKIQNHLQDFSSRCELLTNILDETQNKFEGVMIDLKSTRLNHNNLLIDHEQALTSLRDLEQICNDFKKKLTSAENSNTELENRLSDLNKQYDDLKSEFTDLEIKNMAKCAECAKLTDKLRSAEKELCDLRSRMPSVDDLVLELSECKLKVEQLMLEKMKISESNEKLKNLETELHLKHQINMELASQNDLKSKRVCEMEKEVMELHKSIEEQRVQLGDKEICIKRLELVAGDKTKEVLQLVAGSEDLKERLRLSEEKELELKSVIRGLETELRSVKSKLLEAEKEIKVLKNQVSRAEAENAESRREYEKELNQWQNTKLQHEKKMKELLASVIKYRTEEETKTAKHQQLMSQIEELRMKKNRWKRSMEEWKSMYEAAENEKDEIETKLLEMRSEGHRNSYPFDKHHNYKPLLLDDRDLGKEHQHQLQWHDDEEEELKRQLDFATLTASRVMLELGRLANEKLRLQRKLRQHNDSLHYVSHLEDVKTELERRVKELEMANKELELRLHQLHRDPTSDDATSGDELSPHSSPTKYDGTSTVNKEKTLQEFSLALEEEWGSNILPHWTCTSGPDVRHELSTGNDRIDSKTERDDDISDKMAPTSSANTSAASPDLGIGSDNDRQFSFDENNGENENTKLQKLENENSKLKEQLDGTRNALEETLKKLTALNRNKKQMEKAICKQIYKTNSILKKARINLEDDQSAARN